MVTRSTLTPLLLLTTSLLVSTAHPPTPTSKQQQLRIDFDRSHYDPDFCGIPAAGRARRHGGEDYVDGMDFAVQQPGVNADKGEMPWAVAILTQVNDSSTPILCTGTLISRRHVLTAAHCLSSTQHIPVKIAAARCKPTDHIPLADFMRWSEVKYGGECLTENAYCTEDMVAKSARIKSITLFPFFFEECTGGSDVMLLELKQDVDVPHACLPHMHDVRFPPESTTFHSFSWGTPERQHGDADRLRRHSLSLMKDHCVDEWDHISPDVLCFAPQQHIAQCAGVSGAGLFSTINRRTYVIGTLSSTTSCSLGGNKEAEARYTDTRLFSATIDDALKTVGPYPDRRPKDENFVPEKFELGISS